MFLTLQSGILLVEEYIMNNNDEKDQKLAKRAKLDKSVVPVDTAKWIELARFVKVY